MSHMMRRISFTGKGKGAAQRKIGRHQCYYTPAGEEEGGLEERKKKKRKGRAGKGEKLWARPPLVAGEEKISGGERTLLY